MSEELEPTAKLDKLPAHRPERRAIVLAEVGDVDLILAVHEEHGVMRVLDRFSNLGFLNLCEAIAAGSFIVARLTLDELIRAVLPMTNLAGVLRGAQQMPAADLLAAAGGQRVTSPPTSMEDTAEREGERSRHLGWLLNLLVAVEMGASTPSAPRRETAVARTARRAIAANGVITMLQGAIAERSMTQLPGAPKDQIIDRRRRYPVVSVTTNRIATPAVSRSRETIKADAKPLHATR